MSWGAHLRTTGESCCCQELPPDGVRIHEPQGSREPSGPAVPPFDPLSAIQQKQRHAWVFPARSLPPSRGRAPLLQSCPERTPRQCYSRASPSFLLSYSLWFFRLCSRGIGATPEDETWGAGRKGDPWTSSRWRRHHLDLDQFSSGYGPTPSAPHRKGGPLAAGGAEPSAPLACSVPLGQTIYTQAPFLCFSAHSWNVTPNGSGGSARSITPQCCLANPPEQWRERQQWQSRPPGGTRDRWRSRKDPTTTQSASKPSNNPPPNSHKKNTKYSRTQPQIHN